MMRTATAALALVALAFFACAVTGCARSAETAGNYGDLLKLFEEWRAFQAAPLVDGVPQYTAAAMSAQARDLPSFQRRLTAIDPGGWPVPQQVDWYIVQSEMNGLEFDHRVRKPWATNPAFYVSVFLDQSDQPAREGPVADGSAEIWSYTFPLTPESATRLDARIRTIPALLDQARTNLVGNGRDLWVFGARRVKQQSADLAALESRIDAASASLKADVRRARDATDRFAAWLEGETASKSGPSGIGVENYDWYLKHVQLVPYTWRDEVAIMERELARAQAFLVLEEHRNADLPPLVPIASQDEYARRFDSAITDYMRFLDTQKIMTIRDDMAPALRARVGRFRPGPREFFAEIDYRDPEIMRTHDYHWFDLARMRHDAASRSDPARAAALQHFQHADRRPCHRLGRDDAAGGHGRRPAAIEGADLRVAGRARRPRARRSPHACERAHAGTGGAVRLREHAARLAAA